MKSKKNFIAYRSFYTPVNTIKQFADAGYDTVCVFPAHTNNSRGTPYSQYPPTWLWYDKIDFTPFDNMIEDSSRGMPGAKIVCMIDLNSPVWLEHMHYITTADSFNNLGKAVHNPEWIEATENYLKAFVSYANERYGDRISAYVLACGATDEWYDYSGGCDMPDRRQAFRDYQIAKGRPDPIDIPPISIRDRAPHEGFLRNPFEDKVAIEYWQFCNEAIANTILRFAKLTRDIIGERAEIGCFYGYILEKSTWTLVSCGHLDYERVIDSPNIDFLISPGTYTDRKMGGGSGFLIPSGTAHVRGKRLLHECDQRTHTSNNFLTPYITLVSASAWENEKSTIAGLKRETALGLINGTHLWWFDMWGDFYKGERVMETLARSKKIFDECVADTENEFNEVALIVDPESTYLVNQDHDNTPKMNLHTRNKLNRMGAPYDVYSFNDIPKIKDFSRYKLVIFTSLFYLTAEKKKILDKYVLRDGRHVLWLYAPGIFDGESFDTKNCERLSGIPYKSEGVVSKGMGEWISHYIYDYDTLTPEVLKLLGKEAGVLMTVSELCPVYKRGNLLAIHTDVGGSHIIDVEKKYSVARELFTDREYEIINGEFLYYFEEPDTALFLLS